METEVFSAFTIGGVTRLFSKDEADAALNAGKVVFFAGGTGHPYFSTDTGVVLRAIEMEADEILLGQGDRWCIRQRSEGESGCEEVRYHHNRGCCREAFAGDRSGGFDSLPGESHADGSLRVGRRGQHLSGDEGEYYRYACYRIRQYRNKKKETSNGRNVIDF